MKLNRLSEFKWESTVIVVSIDGYIKLSCSVYSSSSRGRAAQVGRPIIFFSVSTLTSIFRTTRFSGSSFLKENFIADSEAASKVLVLLE